MSRDIVSRTSFENSCVPVKLAGTEEKWKATYQDNKTNLKVCDRASNSKKIGTKNGGTGLVILVHSVFSAKD